MCLVRRDFSVNLNMCILRYIRHASTSVALKQIDMKIFYAVLAAGFVAAHTMDRFGKGIAGAAYDISQNRGVSGRR